MLFVALTVSGFLLEPSSVLRRPSLEHVLRSAVCPPHVFFSYPVISLPFVALPHWLRIAGCTGAETGAFSRASLAIVSTPRTDEC